MKIAVKNLCSWRGAVSGREAASLDLHWNVSKVEFIDVALYLFTFQ